MQKAEIQQKRIAKTCLQFALCRFGKRIDPLARKLTQARGFRNAVVLDVQKLRDTAFLLGKLRLQRIAHKPPQGFGFLRDQKFRNHALFQFGGRQRLEALRAESAPFAQSL